MATTSYINLPGGPRGQAVSLLADNQVVATDGLDVILLTSDSTTATSRTFTLSANSVVGQRLSLVLVSGTSTTAELADTGIQKLSAAWTPLQYDSITLISDGTNWIETARSDN